MQIGKGKGDGRTNLSKGAHKREIGALFPFASVVGLLCSVQFSGSNDEGESERKPITTISASRTTVAMNWPLAQHGARQ